VFRVDLKTFWAWFDLTNTATLSYEAGFWVIFFHGPYPNLGGPYYTVLSYCMIYMHTYLDVNEVHVYYVEENPQSTVRKHSR